MGVAGVHQTGGYVEKAEASEYRAFYRDHDKLVANHLEVDAKRNSDGFRQEKSGCKPDQSCESFSVRD